jgi:triosephosphate isomerase
MAPPRKKIVAGNWKMFTNRASAQALAAEVVAGTANLPDSVFVVLCPPFPYLEGVYDRIKESPVWLGAQNCFTEPEGAYTGEVSPTMLRDVGCQYVILGHSERRHKLGETDAFINKKAHAALAAGLRVILCIGETLEEREAGDTNEVLNAQLTGSLAGLAAADLARVVIAYEPVWAIGTGKNASPAQAQEAHAFVRTWVGNHFPGEETAGRLPILYGGSVKANNAGDLFAQPDVDGGLIGGASLNASEFLTIIRAAVALQAT